MHSPLGARVEMVISSHRAICSEAEMLTQYAFLDREADAAHVSPNESARKTLR